MNPTKRRLLAAIGLAALTAANRAHAAPPGEVGVGELLPEATLRGLNGPDRALSAFRGRPLIINVWASWCGPCRAEMASLERLAWLDHPLRFQIIGISTDDDPRAALAFLRQSNATLSHYLDRRLQMEHMLGASRLPLTVLVGADGRVRAKAIGAKEWDAPPALRWIEQGFGAPNAAPRR